jgi:hypothetical protein
MLNNMTPQQKLQFLNMMKQGGFNNPQAINMQLMQIQRQNMLNQQQQNQQRLLLFNNQALQSQQQQQLHQNQLLQAQQLLSQPLKERTRTASNRANSSLLNVFISNKVSYAEFSSII